MKTHKELETLLKLAYKQNTAGSYVVDNKSIDNLVYMGTSPFCALHLSTKHDPKALELLTKYSKEGEKSKEFIFSLIEKPMLRNTIDPRHFVEALEKTYKQSKSMRIELERYCNKYIYQTEYQIGFTVTSKEVKLIGLDGKEIANEHGCAFDPSFERTISIQGAKQALALLRHLPKPDNMSLLIEPYILKGEGYSIVFA